MSEEKILVIIPAYNEEENIAGVIKSLKKENFKLDCIVINDGSKDNTQHAAEETRL
jgi:glycosyltransferase involved in cell wall biosynthesis